MSRRRYWTITAVLFALAPLFFTSDGALFDTTEVDMPWRLVIVLVPGTLALGATLANEAKRLRGDRGDGAGM